MTERQTERTLDHAISLHERKQAYPQTYLYTDLWKMYASLGQRGRQPVYVDLIYNIESVLHSSSTLYDSNAKKCLLIPQRTLSAVCASSSPLGHVEMGFRTPPV